MAHARPTVALDRNCDRFILAAGPDSEDRFKHVDDDVRIELRRRGSRRPVVLLNDNDGTANDGGRHIAPIEFNAEYGDVLRIVATNKQAGGCGFDEVQLFCKGWRRGKKLLDRTVCRPRERDRLDYEFLDESFRLRP